MKNSKLRGAIVGLRHLHPRGYMTLFRANAHVEIVCACEADEGTLSGFCTDYGLAGYADLETMLAKEKLDFAAIFLPHSDCEAASLACAERGLHVMVEKPGATSSAALERVAESTHRHKVLYTTGYAWRYHPAVRQIKKLIEEGRIGRLVSVEARLSAGRVERYSAGNSLWMLEREKSGGGPMMNLGVHWLDLIMHVTGERIAETSAVSTYHGTDYDIEDSSIVLLRFPSGAAGVLSTSYVVPDNFPGGRDLYLAFRGTQGVLTYAPRYEGEQAGGAGAPPETVELYSSAPGMAGASARKYVFHVDPVAGYSGYIGQAYVDGFVEAIRSKVQTDIRAADAIAVMRVVEAIYQSAKTKTWIEVEE